MTAVLADTNILIYAADANQPVKGAMARTLLDQLEPRLAVSAQVLAEYAHVLTHPGKYALQPAGVIPQIRRMSASWQVFPLTAAVVVAALEAVQRWGMAYYDAQIWAVAALNAIPVVLSEDFPSGATLGGVRFVNPFEPEFDIETL